MKGLPAGRYEARLLQSSYGAGDTMLHETTIVVGRSAEAARADVSPPITAKTSKATTASATEPRESGAKWDAASAGLVKIDPFTNRANATLVQQQGAKDYWVYAALSNNVYVPDSDNSFIKLPKGWEKYNSKSLDFGFYAETHVHRVNGQIVEVVVVFRGTQEWSDWWNANFSPLTSPQEALAKSYAQTIMGLEDLAGAKFTATGHSLGGALAKAAVNGTDKIAIVFNSSPRGPDGSNVRYIEETGDILDALRVNRGGEIAFNFSEVSAKESHAIYPLANGLRKLAE